MASKKNPSPLYEVVQRSGKGGKLELPAWMNQNKAQQQQEDPPQDQPPANQETDAPPKKKQKAKATPDASADPHPPTDTPPGQSTSVGPSSVQAAASTDPAADDSAADAQPGQLLAQCMTWLREPISFHPTRGMLITVGAATVAILAGTFLLGQQIGFAGAAESASEAEQASASMAPHRNQQPNPEILPPDPDDPQPDNTDRRSNGDDPREPGLNYFHLVRLGTGSDSRSYGQQAVQFLEANGIDAALIPTNNGQALELVVLRGFARPLSDPEAQRFKDRLRSLGRKWKAENGGSAWQDLYPAKYQPGSN